MSRLHAAGVQEAQSISQEPACGDHSLFAASPRRFDSCGVNEMQSVCIYRSTERKELDSRKLIRPKEDDISSNDVAFMVCFFRTKDGFREDLFYPMRFYGIPINQSKCCLQRSRIHSFTKVMLRNLPQCFTRARLLYLLCKEGDMSRDAFVMKPLRL